MTKQKKIVRVGLKGLELLRALAHGFDLMTASPGELSLALRVDGLESARIIRAQYEEALQRRTLKRLRTQELIRQRRLGNRLVFELTHQGQIFLLKRRIVESTKKLPKGQLCLVSFDIPVALHARHIFRRLLKEAGFVRQHDSLWVSPFDVGVQLLELIRAIRMTKEVSIFLAVRHG